MLLIYQTLLKAATDNVFCEQSNKNLDKPQKETVGGKPEAEYYPGI